MYIINSSRFNACYWRFAHRIEAAEKFRPSFCLGCIRKLRGLQNGEALISDFVKIFETFPIFPGGSQITKNAIQFIPAPTNSFCSFLKLFPIEGLPLRHLVNAVPKIPDVGFYLRILVIKRFHREAIKFDEFRFSQNAKHKTRLFMNYRTSAITRKDRIIDFNAVRTKRDNLPRSHSDYTISLTVSWNMN